MGLELVLLDFDGTLTVVDKSSLSFVEGYKTDLADDLNLERVELNNLWLEAKSKIDKNPSIYGWRINGKIVAPAFADPFIYSMVVCEIILDDKKLFLGEEDRQRVLKKYFESNYGKTQTIFDEYSNTFLSNLKQIFDVCVITNSDEQKVKDKLVLLSENHKDLEVYGGAKKHFLNDNWDDVPEVLYKEGYSRPLFLRRKNYWDVINKIMFEKGLSKENVCVVGDIYELDLLLPEYKGLRTILLANGNTFMSDINAVKKSPEGIVFNTLKDTYEYLVYLK